MLYQHSMNLALNPGDIGDFLAEELGYNLTPANTFAEGLKDLITKVLRTLPSIPDPDVVTEIEYRINIASSSILGLAVAEDKSDDATYSVLIHCTATMSVTQAMENVETWLEWAEEEYGVDTTARVH